MHYPLWGSECQVENRDNDKKRSQPGNGGLRQGKVLPSSPIPQGQGRQEFPPLSGWGTAGPWIADCRGVGVCVVGSRV